MPRERDPDKELLIVDATMKEILEHGLAALSMDAVARRAQVATGTLYKYVASKTGLVAWTYQISRSTFVNLELEDKGTAVREGVELACRRFIEFCAIYPEQSRFLELIENSDVYLERVDDSERVDAPETIARITGLLERGKQEGGAHQAARLDAAALVSFERPSTRGETSRRYALRGSQGAHRSSRRPVMERRCPAPRPGIARRGHVGEPAFTYAKPEITPPLPAGTATSSAARRKRERPLTEF